MAKRTRRASLFFTIGYEKATPQAVLDALKHAKVDLLVDVRAVAASRRPGFSKRQLAAGLDEQGVGYLHLIGLGTPKEGRLAARAGKYDELHRIFGKHLKTVQAREQLDELTALVTSGQRVCLMCYERDVHQCHRQWIAEIIEERTGVSSDHLVPAPNV